MFRSVQESDEYCARVEKALDGFKANKPSPPARLSEGEGRILFLPPLLFDDYCRLLCLAKVVLDPPHYGAGSTCYDLFSFNLPIVTWPGELIVGRMTQACYRKMDFDALIAHSAEEYVSKAVRVATDRNCRRHVTEQIAARSDVLFNDLDAVREHERFFTLVAGGPAISSTATMRCDSSRQA